MENLNLPVVRGNFPAGRQLSMDDYLKFVTMLLKYSVDRKQTRRQKRFSSVNVMFSMNVKRGKTK